MSYHPKIAAAGEISYFENEEIYNKGIMNYIEQMPEATNDQIILGMVFKYKKLVHKENPIHCNYSFKLQVHVRL